MERRSELIGLLAMLTAMVTLPATVALEKMLAAGYAPEQITWVRCVIQAAATLPLLGLRGERLPLGGLHLARALMFLLMGVPFVAALAWMPLADAQALFFTFPLMVMAFGAVLLHQRVGPVRWACAGAGMGGVLLVIQPGFRDVSAGAALCLLSAAAAAAFVLLTRRLTGRSSPQVLLATPAVIALAVLTPALPVRWVTPGAGDLLVFAGAGLLSLLSNFLLIAAYARIEPGRIAPLAYLQIVVGVVLGWWIFDEMPNAVGAAGIGIVVLSGVVISVRQHRARA